MKILTELYSQSTLKLPQTGQQILAYQKENSLVVYQAYNNEIADFAIKNQFLGGPNFSYSRMSWIKPNFLWMMFRCGWAEKLNQERVLAITINKSNFESILDKAVYSSFNPQYQGDFDEWRNDLAASEVRLQWDPDHDPFGNKIERRAIQLGLKGETLEKFGKKDILRIDDITDFVKLQKKIIDKHDLKNLMVPIESILEISNSELKKKIGIE